MAKLAKDIRNPMLTCHQFHIAQAIVQVLVEKKPNLQRTLMKVKSQIGIEGNETADRLANTAVQHAVNNRQYGCVRRTFKRLEDRY